MSLFLAATIALGACLASALALAMLWRMVREQAGLRRGLDVRMFEVLLPKDLQAQEHEGEAGEEVRKKIAVAEQFLSTLSRLPATWLDRLLHGLPVIVFEIAVAEDGMIRFYAGAERPFLDHLEKQIYAFYPEAEVRPASDFTIFDYGDTIQTGFLSLRRSHHLPIATYKELEADPMQAVTGALARIQQRDAAVVQFVCQPSSNRLRQQGRKATRRTIAGQQTDVDSGSKLARASQYLLTPAAERARRQHQGAERLTPRAQRRIELVEQKLTEQQFDVTLRVAVSTRQPEEAERVFGGLIAAFNQYDLPDLNSLHLIRPRSKPLFLRDLIFRIPRPRLANTLSTTEMASLFHFPLPTTGTPNIGWRGAKVAPIPAGLPQSGVQLGDNVYRGISTPVYVADDDRRRHLYLIGQTGTGKTTLFLNMIVQDMAAGRGVGVVDPHGDLIEDLLLHIPSERQQDVILFDPRDTEHPLGFNILQVADEGQKDMVVNEVVTILQTLAARLNPESIGPMFEHYLRNALLALIEDPAATLLDVPRMFVDKDFRQTILKATDNPTVKQFWAQEFQQSQRGQLSADMLSYVISKLGRFISNRTVRNIIGQAESSFNVRQVMDEQKILLCNLSKGSLGDINSDLLGFVLVSQLQIAALGRANVPESARRDFYLYLDEFQNFTTPSIAVILSEARKYRLNLHLTHQFIKQLDDKIRQAVFGNVGTIVSYRIGPEDAGELAKQFEPVFSDYDLLNLERFKACVRLLAHGTPQRPFSLNVRPSLVGGEARMREAVRLTSRRRFGRARAGVEEEIMKRFQVGSAPNEGGKPEAGGYMSESLLDVS